MFCRSSRCLYSFFFFFSSRRRHTRSDRDWSSDVCSSDLEPAAALEHLVVHEHLDQSQQAFAILGREAARERSEEHTSELQSRSDLVCRLLLEKKKKKKTANITTTYLRHGDEVTLHIILA